MRVNSNRNPVFSRLSDCCVSGFPLPKTIFVGKLLGNALMVAVVSLKPSGSNGKNKNI